MQDLGVFRELGSFASAYLVIMAVPGPNFAMLVQSSVHGSLRGALSTAAGLATGASLLAALAFAGLLSVGRSEAWQGLAHAAFALTLVMIGIRALRRSMRGLATPLSSEASLSWKASRASRSFVTALVTAVANPLTAVFFATSMLELGLTELQARPALMAMSVFVIALSWFGFVSLMFCFTPVQKAFQLLRRPLDAGLGIYLIFVGMSHVAAPLIG
ncbi:threonine/homoserine/homoserine lactone efflux protein [Bosea sp. BE125]|uniref:LysE family transporter n=1 Tax=Bosea sp. BE125 TaxID=2817909 RepID=UPI0028615371|nr:LysE family transporter [Bosea sp. BE125]MDR6873383.1 threonine/homoserine/homoserine lactone efflux protein [Bosea sp. BE125]